MPLVLMQLPSDRCQVGKTWQKDLASLRKALGMVNQPILVFEWILVSHLKWSNRNEVC